MDMRTETEISPTLRALLVMLDDPLRKAAELEGAKQSAENVENCADTTSDALEEDELGEVFDNDTDDNVMDAYEETHAKEPYEGMGAAWDFDFDRREDGEVYDQVGQL